ncbi:MULTISPECIES: tripartite tricarboxylate transporter TctB family protein [unclassified Rhizobium]|uniref:tripartite tricarboxylate transporter TctB family protein n=1 Tax=unclassified Rhizobium TaxID=2613769 RepID=UPI001C82F0C9|nr:MULTISPECIES: tripartite tricarboxylate transporter TctB family protein [unclassified Rhizobium]MBX5215596.1 tripartite tricarboxylate transporter TctB family protein [Rhizobium sp. NLR9a]MBX5232760.1 tripartite tricarboxylate transporter TctB family protein [Rhizobium sp. NLR4a]MBX5245393.1 tripartite tricarboxylate transporter TctB family protein [Rhizobium sp. NLR3b]MBX5250393.1 tripartite tricarboxylate transporter TctB family protein [Rhizobium sp. NLR4b]MBX5269108.1 tripartite tricarb
MKSISLDRTNAICGALFVATGTFFAYQSVGLDLGTALRMGPGYFPFILACALILLGAIIFFQALRVEGEPVDPFAWRGMLFILPAPVFFGLTVRGLGFAPALFFTAFIACFASRKMNLVFAVILSLLLTIFSVAVFSYGLGLPFERFGPWVRF